MTRHNWTRNELLIAFNLYCKTPFGRLHRNNPDVIQLASVIGRTPSAVAMKLVNFASLDPAHQRRNVSGLRNVSRLDREIFEEFSLNWEALAFESEQALARLATPTDQEVTLPEGQPTVNKLSGCELFNGFSAPQFLRPMKTVARCAGLPSRNC